MTHDPTTEQPLEIQRKRLLYRATHRGTKEADVIIGGFFQENLARMTALQLAESEEFLDLSDLDLIDWIMGRKPVPERWVGSLFDEILAWSRKRQGDR